MTREIAPGPFEIAIERSDGIDRDGRVNYITRVWLAMRTWNTDGSGTDSSIVLIIHQEPPLNNRLDAIHHTFSDTDQQDQEKGQANLYDFEPDNTLPDYHLSDSSIRIAIRGRDMWRPEHVVVWGQGPKNWLDRDSGEIAIPIGIETDIRTRLSTDQGEGKVSIPIRRAYMGYGDMMIRRLLIAMRTSTAEHSGTDSPIQLRIEVPGTNPTVYEIPDTPQREQDRGQANLYFAPVVNPFTWNDLESGGTVVLRIGGSDAWRPDSLFIFGLNEASERPTELVPLVFEPAWSHGVMSQDSSEGVGHVELPIAQLPW